MSDASSPFSRRLRQARTMRGWSLRELSARIDGAVTYAALAKYENGEMSPSSPVLLALAEALMQSPDFFFRPTRLELTNVRFRKKSRLSATTEKAFCDQALDFVERYQEIEELTGEAHHFVPPFPRREIKAPKDAEKLAMELRGKWELGLDPLPNVQQLLEGVGIKVFELPTEDRQFDGLKAETEAGPVIVLASWLNQNRPRKRMTEVHELAHIVLPFPEDVDEAEEEDAAARFAGAFLLPEETFRKAFGQHRQNLGLGELIELKLMFGVSIMAIMKRAEQLELISASVFRRFCMYANQHGWRKNGEPGDDRYVRPEQHGRFRQLVMRAVAEEIISLSKGAELLKQDLNSVRRDLQEVIS